MKNHITSWILSSFLLTGALATAGSWVDSYYPLNNGDTKTFVYGGSKHLTLDTADDGGGEYEIDEDMPDEDQSAAEYYQKTATGIYLEQASVNSGWIDIYLDPAVLLINDNLLQNGGTASTSTTVSQPGIDYSAIYKISIKAAGKVVVPAGTFANCRNITVTETAIVPGQGTFTVNAMTAVLAPSVGIIKKLVSKGVWAELVSGTVGGTDVGILATGPPMLTIKTPVKGQRIAAADNNVAVTGSVSGYVPGMQVFYQTNSGPWASASVVGTNWSGSVQARAGTNVVNAYALDSVGRASPTVSVAFQFVVTAPLVVQTNGNGTVSLNSKGQILDVGASYTIKAIPIGNNLFSNWVGGTTLPYAVLSTSSTYTFVMQSNLVLQANFVPNHFLLEQGTYNGLFLDANNVTEASSGFFTLTLTKSGAFTGKIMTAGGTYSLPTKRQFDVGGRAQFTVPTKQTMLAFDLQLGLSDPASQQISGTVSDGTWTAQLTADRASFNATKNEAINYEGRYTLAIAGSEEAAASPGGFGWAALSISSAGLITLKGNLADGTALGQKVSVSKDGRWPFYAAYAPPPAGNGGAVLSWITFSNQPATALGGTLCWFRPAGKLPAVYQSGFTNLAVRVRGSAYNPAEAPLLALTSGQVTLGGGNLPLTITNQINLAWNNIITLTAAAENTNKLALKINKTTGAISGSFANPANSNQTLKVNGVLLQNQTNAAGYFLGTNQSGAFLLEMP